MKDARKRYYNIIIETLKKYGVKYEINGEYDVLVWGDDCMFDVIRAEKFGISYNGRIVDTEDFKKRL